MAPAGAGGKGNDPVIDLGRNAGVDYRLLQAVVQKRLLRAVVGKAQAIGLTVGGHLIGCKDLVPGGASIGGQVDIGVGAKIVLLPVLFQGSEHGSVIHVVAVDQGVEVRQIPGIPGLHKDGSHGAGALPPGAAEIVVVVRPLQEGVGNPGVGDQDPAQDVGVHLPQRGEIHGRQGVGVGVHIGHSLLPGGPAGDAALRPGPLGEVRQPRDASRLLIGHLPCLVVPQLPQHHAAAHQENDRQRGQQDPLGSLPHTTSSPAAAGPWNGDIILPGRKKSKGPRLARALEGR